MKKVKKKKMVEKPPEPLEIEDPRDKIPKAYLDFSDDEETKIKLPRMDNEDEIPMPDYNDENPDQFSSAPPPPPPPVPVPVAPQVELPQAVLAAKAKIESLLPTQPPSTGKNINLPEHG